MFKVQIKSRMRYYDTSIRMAKIKNTEPSAGVNVEQLELPYTVGGNSTVTLEISLAISYKVKYILR